MNIEISYEVVERRHPELVVEIIAKLRKGKSKNNKAIPSQLKWFYNWGECFECNSFSLPVKSLENQIQEQIDRSFVGLFATIGRWYGRSDMPIWNGPKSSWTPIRAGLKASGEIPSEVKSIIVQLRTKEMKEKARIDSLTEEERATELLNHFTI